MVTSHCNGFHPNSNFVLKCTDTEEWKLWVEERRQPASGSGSAGSDASGRAMMFVRRSERRLTTTPAPDEWIHRNNVSSHR